MTTVSNLSTLSKISDVRKAGVLLFISGMEFILLVMVCEATYPGYSVHANAISDLGATSAPTFLLYEPAVLLWGLLWLLAAYLYWKGRHRRGSMLLNLLPGLGILLVGAFPENVNVAMHSVGSVLGIFTGVLVALLSYRRVHSPLRYLLSSMGGASLIAALVEFGGHSSGPVQQTLGPGGWERAIVYPLLIWEVAYGSYLLAAPGEVSSSGTPRAPSAR